MPFDDDVRDERTEASIEALSQPLDPTKHNDECPDSCACRVPLPKPAILRGMWRNRPVTFAESLEMAALHTERRREWERRGTADPENFESAPYAIDSTRSGDIAEPEARAQGRWPRWLRWLNH